MFSDHFLHLSLSVVHVVTMTVKVQVSGTHREVSVWAPAVIRCLSLYCAGLSYCVSHTSVQCCKCGDMPVS